MGDRLLEGRAAQSLVASFAPPFDRKVVEARFGVVISDRLGLHARYAQDFRGAAMQRLPAALKQAFVSGVLNQRVLEPIGGLRRRALDKQKVGVGKPFH